jgi:hypothetical protein
VSDIDGREAERVAAEIGGVAMQTDVSREADVQQTWSSRRSRNSDTSTCSATTLGIFIDGGPEDPDDEVGAHSRRERDGAWSMPRAPWCSGDG